MTADPDDPQDALVRRFAAARDRGEAELAAELWETLIVLQKDRIRTWVVTWRHETTGERIAPDDFDDVVQAALIKAVRNMVTTFRGSTRAEFIAALRTCTHFAASDHRRRAVRDERRSAGSLDATGDGRGRSPGTPPASAGRGGFAGEVADAGVAADERAQEKADARERVRAAIERIDNEKQRRVVALGLDGVPDEEIARALDINVTYVYKLRERGLKRLKEVIDDDER